MIAMRYQVCVVSGVAADARIQSPAAAVVVEIVMLLELVVPLTHVPEVEAKAQA